MMTDDLESKPGGKSTVKVVEGVRSERHKCPTFKGDESECYHFEHHAFCITG